ncbi:MAG: Sensor histidine kinase GlnK [Desulfovibrio sp.]
MENKTGWRERRATLITLILLTAFLGQVEIRPFSDDFRFSLAVPALAFILLFFPYTSPVIYSLIAAAVMLALRGIIAAAAPSGMALADYWAAHSSVMLFYLTYGVLFAALRVRKLSKRGAPLFFGLLTCEVAANLVELSMTHLFSTQPLERGVFFVVVVGIMRSSATAAVYRLTIYWQDRHDREQHEARYRRMLLFFSNIKTDLLFFHKSMDDIESAMKLSYALYEKLRGGALGEEALSVSRRIHDVKKEYQRIIASMEKVLSGEYMEHPMRLADIFSLLQSSTEALLSIQNIPVTVTFTCAENWIVGRYYTVISIMNNLVINAVEAMADRPGGGMIAVSARREGENCIMEVADDGPGIPEDLLDCIFEAGFSTKFDPSTGAMSTGLGLVHVKNIVETHLGGSITVTSQPDGALFRIVIPEDRLTAEERSRGDDA